MLRVTGGWFSEKWSSDIQHPSRLWWFVIELQMDQNSGMACCTWILLPSPLLPSPVSPSTFFLPFLPPPFLSLSLPPSLLYFLPPSFPFLLDRVLFPRLTLNLLCSWWCSWTLILLSLHPRCQWAHHAMLGFMRHKVLCLWTLIIAKQEFYKLIFTPTLTVTSSPFNP